MTRTLEPPFIRIYEGSTELGTGGPFFIARRSYFGLPACGFWTSAHLRERELYRALLEDRHELTIKIVMCPEHPDSERPVRATAQITAGFDANALARYIR